MADSIFDYVRRDLRHPRGAFYSAEDADSPTPDGSGHGGKGEGAFYLWRKDELEAVLGGASALICSHFGVTEAGNVPPSHDPHGEFTGANILHQCSSILDTAERFKLRPEVASARLEEALLRLREVRSRRPRPGRDEKIIAGWNGLMISALARGAVVLGRPALAEEAAAAAEFLRVELYDAARNRLYRSHCGTRGEAEAFTEDYANVIQGSLDLYEATGESRWLWWARDLQRTCDSLFWDENEGGYFASAATDPHLVLRLKDDYDGAEPAANSVAAANLFRLRALFPRETIWAERGRRTLDALRSQWTKHPQALPQLLCAIEWALETPRQVVLAGEPGSSAWLALQSELFWQLGPRRAILYATGRESAELLQLLPELASFRPSEGPAAYVCQHYTCQAPARSVEALREALVAG